MQVDLSWRLKTVAGAVATAAQVIGKLFGVIANAEPVVGLVVVTVAGDKLGFAVALEAAVWRDIEDAVDAVAVFRRIAPGLGLQVRDVFGVELHSNVGGNVGVGHRYAVDRPGDLMAATHMH